jgi:hypothetical protein
LLSRIWRTGKPQRGLLVGQDASTGEVARGSAGNASISIMGAPFFILFVFQEIPSDQKSTQSRTSRVWNLGAWFTGCKSGVALDDDKLWTDAMMRFEGDYG